jgi:hypothetical protein
VLTGKYLPTFGRIVVPSSSESNNPAAGLLDPILGILETNVGKYLSVKATLYPRTL